MAGLGKRMRPHTLTTAKPLLPIAGRPIVERLMEDIVRVCDQPVHRIAFITSPLFGPAVEQQLLHVAEKLGAVGSIHYQEEALGTAHAILCAQEHLDGPVVVAFADTLFKADFVLDSTREGIIWVKKIENPRAFGVVELDEEGIIRAFHEKPEQFVSDLAIIGIYFFKDGAYLRRELQYLVDHGIMDKGEYQLTSALENMKSKGTAFLPGTVSEWLDCGNKDATVHTNSRYLEYLQERGNETLVDPSAVIENCQIIPPCYIGPDCHLNNVQLGPHVSVGRGSKIENAVVESSLLGEHAQIQGVHLRSSMTGAHAKVRGYIQRSAPGPALELSISDHSEVVCR